MTRGRLFHVGIDSSRTPDNFTLGRCGPVFTRERVIAPSFPRLLLYDFRFIPTRETCDKSTERRTYDSLRLSQFLPQRFARYTVHFDPDVTNFTYGEPADPNNPRARQIRDLQIGTSLFFVSSLVPFSSDFPTPNQTGMKAKYLVGGFKIKLVCDVNNHRMTPRNAGRLDKDARARIAQNSHWKRPNDNFWCAVGERDGRTNVLFTKAFPLTQGRKFEPTKLGRRLYGNRIYQRGSKPIRVDDDADWLWRLVTPYFR
jgi:Nucleotide modification associated domain 3